MTYYKTVDGDRIDLIVLEEYGSHDMLATVLAHNMNLCSKSMSLKAGVSIVLPRVEDMIEYENKKKENEEYKGWLEL